MEKSEFITKEITEEELKEIASGIKSPFGTVKCAECYRDAAVQGFVLRRKKTGSLFTTHFPKALCEECAKEKVALYNPDEWTLETWL